MTIRPSVSGLNPRDGPPVPACSFRETAENNKTGICDLSSHADALFLFVALIGLEPMTLRV